MGRGRAKAKQTKVARQLKYSTPLTDLEALRRELAGEPTAALEQDGGEPAAQDDDFEAYAESDDPYLADDEDDR